MSEGIQEWERELIASLVGQRIVAAKAAPSSDGGDYLGSVFLSLGDRRTICFDGWGHDYWGLGIDDVTDDPPAPSRPLENPNDPEAE